MSARLNRSTVSVGAAMLIGLVLALGWFDPPSVIVGLIFGAVCGVVAGIWLDQMPRHAEWNEGESIEDAHVRPLTQPPPVKSGDYRPNIAEKSINGKPVSPVSNDW